MNTRPNSIVMLRLIHLARPLLWVMLIAILMGSLGFFCASFITVFVGYGIVDIIENQGVNIISILSIIMVIAILRGILHYIEQYCNHYIAFKLLALIRDKVFSALRKLAPAKLDGQEKGNLVSIITSDIELLEVFYAHTVSPICIALITSTFVIVFLSGFHSYYGVIALMAHAAVGILIPSIVSIQSKKSGENFRKR